jgi:aconitate hydratase
VREDDAVYLKGVESLAPGSAVTAVLHHADGSTEEFAVKHGLNAEQVEWFRAGSALGLLAAGA